MSLFLGNSQLLFQISLLHPLLQFPNVDITPFCNCPWIFYSDFFVLFSSLDSCLGCFYWPMFRRSVQSTERLLRGILHGCPRVLILSYGFHITPIRSRTLSTISTKALSMLTTVVLQPWLHNLQHLCPIHSYFTPHI